MSRLRRDNLGETPRGAEKDWPSQLKLFIPLFLVIVWAFIWGLIRGNNFGDVFLDFNNWLYFLLILPIFWVYNNRDVGTMHRIVQHKNTTQQSHPDKILYEDIPSRTMQCIVPTQKNNDFIKNILTILAAAIVWLSIKSLILLYIFSHQFVWALPEVYQWVRDTGVGEITPTGTGFYRVFIQSQIYALFLFFILLLFEKREARSEKREISSFQFPVSSFQFPKITDYGLLILCFTNVLLSWSRSFWLGFLFTLLLYYGTCPPKLERRRITLLLKIKLSKLLKQFAKIVIIAAISFTIILAIIKLPPKIEGGDLASLLGKRATKMEAASSSRVNQLKPLLLAISKHPIIGSGLGTTVTYFSNDPRIVPTTAGGSGEITTYAFEWGYLDMILKFGLVGLGIYLYLIYWILKRLLKSEIRNPKSEINSKFQIKNTSFQFPVSSFQFGFALALISLLVVNIFSPYLNHPLGIGFIILAILVSTKIEHGLPGLPG